MDIQNLDHRTVPVRSLRVGELFSYTVGCETNVFLRVDVRADSLTRLDCKVIAVNLTLDGIGDFCGDEQVIPLKGRLVLEPA